MVSSLTTPPILVKPFANEGDKNTIPTDATGTQAASLEEGFPVITATPINEGGIPPKREDFNGLGFLTTSQYFYLQNGGRFTFNSTVSAAINGYPEGAVLQYTNPNTGQSYEVTSLIPNNTYNFVTNPEYIDGLKWRKSFSEDLTNYVTTNTRQDITNLKNFSNDGSLSDNAQVELTAENIDVSNAPASSKYSGLIIRDVNGTRIGKLEVEQYSSGAIGIRIAATNNGTHGIIGVQVATNGTVSTSAPTPASSDNSTKIATTAWVKTDAQPAASYGSSAGMTWGSVYTCPANGYVRIGAKARDNSSAYLRLNSTSGTILWQHGDYGGQSLGYGVVPVAKGTKVVAHGGASNQVATFYYGK